MQVSSWKLARPRRPGARRCRAVHRVNALYRPDAGIELVYQFDFAAIKDASISAIPIRIS